MIFCFYKRLAKPNIKSVSCQNGLKYYVMLYTTRVNPSLLRQETGKNKRKILK